MPPDAEQEGRIDVAAIEAREAVAGFVVDVDVACG